MSAMSILVGACLCADWLDGVRTRARFDEDVLAGDCLARFERFFKVDSWEIGEEIKESVIESSCDGASGVAAWAGMGNFGIAVGSSRCGISVASVSATFRITTSSDVFNLRTNEVCEGQSVWSSGVSEPPVEEGTA